MSDITTGSLTEREKQHLRTLRALSERRRENVMYYTDAIAKLEKGDAPAPRPGLRLVVVENK